MELKDTLDYLLSLSSCVDHYRSHSLLLDTLIASLRTDGYQLVLSQQNNVYSHDPLVVHHVSNGVDNVYQQSADSTRLLSVNNGSPDLTSIIMVVLCVVFAALASGLTQVLHNSRLLL